MNSTLQRPIPLLPSFFSSLCFHLPWCHPREPQEESSRAPHSEPSTGSKMMGELMGESEVFFFPPLAPTFRHPQPSLTHLLSCDHRDLLRWSPQLIVTSGASPNLCASKCAVKQVRLDVLGAPQLKADEFSIIITHQRIRIVLEKRLRLHHQEQVPIAFQPLCSTVSERIPYCANWRLRLHPRVLTSVLLHRLPFKSSIPCCQSPSSPCHDETNNASTLCGERGN